MAFEEMRKSFWPLLTRVKRPGRYAGGEWGSLPVKDASMNLARVCLAFPDTYEVGMSYLGYQVLYSLIKTLDYADVERAYCPWIDMELQMRKSHFPLCSLESFRPLREFDMVGITLQYELCSTNILTVLDLGGIPLRSSQRDRHDPFVIGGGAGALSPAPLEPFFDAFCLGDGEAILPALLCLIRETKGGYREERLQKIASLPGMYVPGVSALPAKRHIVEKPDEAFVHRTMIVPNSAIVHDRVAVQVFKGCTRGCRFCQAGMIDRPLRERSAASIASQVKELLRYTGWEELGLLSLATCDWTPLEELLNELSPLLRSNNIKLSLPSLRMDAFSVELASRLEGLRRGGLTFAPEAGSARLRRVINKGIDDDDIDATLDATFRHGWERVKLYFMMGLPTETEEDLKSILDIADRALGYARKYKRRGDVSISVAGFVPKAHTPFQWEGQTHHEELRERGRYIKGLVRNRKISLSYHEPEQTFLEGVFARGGTELAEPIEEAWRRGARFDGWTECFDFERWMETFRDLDIDPEDWATRNRTLDETLPWDIIDTGVTKHFLARERERAFREEPTPDCRHGTCQSCGWQRYEGACVHAH